MFIDDVIYVGLLLVSVAFGKLFRDLKESATKQWVSTSLGLAIACIVSGRHVAHSIVSTLISAVILAQCSWRIRHTVNFIFIFFYLMVVFRLAHWFGLPEPPAHTNLIQMMLTLRLAGLGFEIVASKGDEANGDSLSTKALQNVGFVDVIHYAYSYMGFLTGPYYRYRTYWDCINRPFAAYVDCWTITQTKLKTISVLIILHLAFANLFPVDYIQTEDFQGRSFLYRFWYVYPTFVTFKTRIYAGMMLSECVCQMAGLGAYPTSCETVSGLGPRKYKDAEEIAADEDKLKVAKIDFECVHNVNIYGVETCHEVRKAMKMWNTTVQYWMAANVYKQFPYKPLRTAATFTLSSLWHGYALGYHICIVSVLFYLPFEDMYIKFYNYSPTDSMARKVQQAFLAFMRMSCMSYLGCGFQTLTFGKTYGYYSSIFFAGHVFVAILWASGQLAKPYLIPKEETSNKQGIKKEGKIQ